MKTVTRNMLKIATGIKYTSHVSFSTSSILAQKPEFNFSFQHKELSITKSTTLKDKPKPETLVFGKFFTDHMLECEYDEEDGGWKAPKIVPYHNLSLPPSTSSLHYAIQCFEGLKAYYDTKEGKRVLLFRPEKNATRMFASCQRLGLPAYDQDEWLKCIAELVNLEKDWIPKQRGYSLYVRPTMIATEPTLGVAPPKKALFYVILTPVGPYFKTGFKPVKLLADPRFVRAFPGGTGGYKLGANYGPTILPQLEAAKKGYSQVLWILDNGKGQHTVSEVGTMNFFFFTKNEKGESVLLTCPLDGTVLPGVTRDSIIDIAKEWGIKVEERHFTMQDLKQAVEEKRAIEAFGAGTACIVSPVSTINYMDKDIEIPVPENGLAVKLFNHMLGIQHGEIPHKFSVEANSYLQ